MGTTNDSVSDLLTRIRNALKALHRYVDVSNTRFNTALLRILKEQGFIENYLVKEDEKQGMIRVYLKYAEGRQSVIHGLKRISRPGLRRFVTHTKIPRVYGGLGISILSTSTGVMAGDEARKKHIGGELVCYVW